METEKIFITAEEAISILPDGEEIHTFLNSPPGLIGADWSREDAINHIRRADFRELAGPWARSLKHGIAVYNKNCKFYDICFIATDEEKLAALEMEYRQYLCADRERGSNA